MSDHSVCPHPRETFVKEEAVYSYRCPECKASVCLDCRRHGWTDVMIPLVSWMTGTCDACYRNREARAKVSKQFHDEREGRLRLARVWDEARAAGPDATNPHEEPTHWEKHLLEQNEWLRDEEVAW